MKIIVLVFSTFIMFSLNHFAYADSALNSKEVKGVDSLNVPKEVPSKDTQDTDVIVNHYHEFLDRHAP